MKKINTFLFILTVLSSGFVPFHYASATEPGVCSATNVRWANSTNRIYINGNVSCTLSEIKTLGSSSMPLTLVDPIGKVWLLEANLYLQEGAKLQLHGDAVGGDVNELRLKSNNLFTNDFVIINADWGIIDIDSVNITSWDTAVTGPDIEYSVLGRAYIKAVSRLASDGITPQESRLDIKNSDIGYLGYNSSLKYGLSWKVEGPHSIFDAVGVYGDVINSKIHNNYFGLYTYGAEAMTFINNEIYNNLKYGLDPHDDSDHLLIDNNYVHHNGNHGIICSQRCNNLTITNNISSYNTGNGVMLHRNVSDSLLKNNEFYHNTDSGIAIFDSHNNQISHNISKYNAKGIRFSVGSSNNATTDNDFSDNTKYGIYTYQGNDIPTSGDGRIKNNTFNTNTVNTNNSVGARILQADNNTFTNNEFSGNNSYAIYLENTNDNIFENNSTTLNALNYYYAKYTSINTIQDADAFSIKIGDTTSKMIITDSANSILKNSKNLSTKTYPDNSSILLTRTETGSSIINFNRLNFTATPALDNLTIKSLTWNTTDDFYKKWTVVNNSTSTIDALFIVGDLSPSLDYDIIVNGVVWNTLTANSDGEISFTYAETFISLKTFEVKASL